MGLRGGIFPLVTLIIFTAGIIYVWNRFFSAHSYFLQRCYLNDFLAGLTLYPLWYVACALLFRYREGRLFFRDTHILIGTLVAGIFWEYVAPFFRVDSVSDPFDIIAYLIGSIVFCVIRRLWNKLPK